MQTHMGSFRSVESIAEDLVRKFSRVLVYKEAAELHQLHSSLQGQARERRKAD
jgi:hypothetical protein